MSVAGGQHKVMVKNTQSAKRKLAALKAEMAAPRLAASVRKRSQSVNRRTIELTGFARMRSRHLPVSDLRVEYAIKFMKQPPGINHATPAQLASACTECFIESVDEKTIPDGDYLLHFDNDGVHHVRKHSGQWVYLAIP